MATTFVDQLIGIPVFLPNFEAPTSVTVSASLTTNATTTAKRSIAFDQATYDVYISFTGANIQGLLTITLPSGDVIDLNSYTDVPNASLEPIMSSVTVTDANGLSRIQGSIGLQSNSSVRVFVFNSAVPASASLPTVVPTFNDFVDTSANKPMTFAAGDMIHARFTVPLTRLAGGMSAYGAGIATLDRSGLVWESPQIDISAQLSGAGLGSIFSATARVKRDINGKYKVFLDLSFSWSASSSITRTLAIAGLQFRTGAAKYSCVASYAEATGVFTPSSCLASFGSNTLVIYHANVAATYYCLTGEAEIIGRPSWA